MKHVQNFFKGLNGNVPDDLMPIVQLLPLATMGSQGHHTVLECALTLTLNRLLRYRIGFYSTLVPDNPHLFPESLKKLFLDVEHATNNRHILCFWEGNNLQGVQYTEKHEIDKLYNASLVNGAFRHQFGKLPLKPTKRELFQLPCLWNVPH